jgi:acyl dehydratase
MHIRGDVYDEEGVPVFTEYSGALLRGVKGVGEALGAADLPVPPKASQLEEVWTGNQYIGLGSAQIYEACSGISFPIHTSMQAALAAGLPGTLYHGTATLSRAVGALIDREAHGDPLRVRAVHCRFTAMVRPGTAIFVRFLGRAEGEGMSDLFFDVINHEGKPAVSRGCLTVANGE